MCDDAWSKNVLQAADESTVMSFASGNGASGFYALASYSMPVPKENG